MQHKSNTLPSTPRWRKRGYSLSYRAGETNHCPGCGKRHWIIGRLMAECAFCGTALALMHDDGLPDELQAVA